MSVISRVERVSPVKDGESKIDTMQRALKSALHRDYPITGDDGGYGFVVLTKGSSEKKVQEALRGDIESISDDADGNPHMDAVARKVKAALADDLVVMVGGGSGNNTVAYILAIVDPATKEFVYWMASNFGSDD